MKKYILSDLLPQTPIGAGELFSVLVKTGIMPYALISLWAEAKTAGTESL